MYMYLGRPASKTVNTCSELTSKLYHAVNQTQLPSMLAVKNRMEIWQRKKMK